MRKIDYTDFTKFIEHAIGIGIVSIENIIESLLHTICAPAIFPYPRFSIKTPDFFSGTSFIHITDDSNNGIIILVD